MAKKDRRRNKTRADGAEIGGSPHSRESLKLWLITAGYGPPKPATHIPENSVVMLWCSKSDPKSRPAPLYFGAVTQRALLKQASDKQSVIVLDLAPLFNSEKYSGDSSDLKDDIYEREAAMGPAQLCKSFGKVVARTLQKLHMRSATLVAFGRTSCLAVKWLITDDPRGYRAGPSSSIKRVILLHPLCDLAPFLKRSFDSLEQVPQVDLIFDTAQAKLQGEALLRDTFATGTTITFPTNDEQQLLQKGLDLIQHNIEDSDSPFDPDFVDGEGRSLWFSDLQLVMDRNTKQSVQKLDDLTSEMIAQWHAPWPPAQTKDSSASRDRNGQAGTIDEAEGYNNSGNGDRTASDEIGAIVLRGNRCILVRSLEKEWQGVRFPSLPPKGEETAQSTAVRAVSQLCQVDGISEVRVISDLAPLHLYLESRVVHLYIMYAVEPPPPGPLEDADIEDEEDCYDWYTFSRAVNAQVGPRTVATLYTLAFSLDAAAKAGRIPIKWGGVFGQDVCAATNSGQNILHSNEHHTVKDTSRTEKHGLAAVKDAARTKTGEPIPVTVLSGFLGAGKTTLLQHILRNKMGLRVALIINDMGSVNVDADRVRTLVKGEEKMLELSNGCICCTLRGDLLETISHLSTSGDTFDCILIESSGISEPLPVAETFTFKDDNGTSLSSLARLDTMVTVVDAFSFFHELETVESLRSRGWQAAEQDVRKVAHLLCDQVEFADVIVLNKCDLVSEDEKNRVQALVAKLNPGAKLIESVRGQVEPKSILGTGRFDFSNAKMHPEWLAPGEHTPETEEYGISSFCFRATRPFHPERLKAAAADAAAALGPFSCLVRAKGIVWLATETGQHLQGIANYAGKRLTVDPGPPWWACVDRCDWPQTLAKDIEPLWHEPHGDRQTELVVIGQNMDEHCLRQALDLLLVSDQELAAGPDHWSCSFQEYPNFTLPEENHDHDHDHTHCDHDHDHDHTHCDP